MAGVSGFDNLGDNAFNQYKWEGQGEFIRYLRSPKCPIETIWLDLYRGIAESKLSNKNVETISEDLVPLEAKKKLLGQAYFLRALMYCFRFILKMHH
jgi:hypothetical protein